MAVDAGVFFSSCSQALPQRNGVDQRMGYVMKRKKESKETEGGRAEEREKERRASWVDREIGNSAGARQRCVSHWRPGNGLKALKTASNQSALSRDQEGVGHSLSSRGEGGGGGSLKPWRCRAGRSGPGGEISRMSAASKTQQREESRGEAEGGVHVRPRGPRERRKEAGSPTKSAAKALAVPEIRQLRPRFARVHA
ncbi:uncharacterized protein ARB_05221 [Trichophyton benhamiae CBS 112371]|uniref:Uncharacterized protein n=1 Tax=Arthroderma benhamiae (strain ATCC MYA-4681 / CBS 112371) TaxID=663331 RepID=D4ALM3_ARTBC|nr:uncharacterized protein ARB_05221 [Trichophyton benhamiae CBS 112371]EFE36282.1 hypothetical protein ARB_05221 [Trichophyton benhamiae CBS 112371]